MRHFYLLVLFISFSLGGCAEKNDKPQRKPQAPVENTKTQLAKEQPPAKDKGQADTRSCKEQASELRVFLTNVLDKDAKVEAPWPTGDTELDAWIEEVRPKVRKAMEPADPSERQPSLSEGIDTSVDEEMYRDCPQGLAALQAVGAAAPDKRREALIKIADAVEACNCKVKIAWLKASYYMGQRGPD